MHTLRKTRGLGSLLVVLFHILEITSSTLQTLHFATPGLCTSNNTFNQTFLMSTNYVRTRAECGKICAMDRNCRSMVMSGEPPNIQCKLFEQGTNKYGIYLQPDPQSHFMEKLGVHTRGTVEHCLNQTHGNKKDPNGPCARINAWLYVGERLLVGEYMCSFNLAYRLILRPEDGNLVILNVTTNEIILASTVSPPGFPTHHVTLLPDGNLVVQDAAGNIGWSSNSPCTPSFMVLRGQTGKLKIGNALDSNLICWESP